MTNLILVPPQPRRLPQHGAIPIAYVALGDSTVAGVGATRPELSYVGRIFTRLRQHYPHAQLFNLGLPGETALGVVMRQMPKALSFTPNLVTLSVGPNDIMGGRTPLQFEQDLEKLFATLTRQTAAVIVANLLPDVSVAPLIEPELRMLVSTRTIEFNAALQRAGQRHAVTLVDLFAASRAEVPDHPEYVGLDAYHPSDAGYVRWAELMWLGVARHLPQ